MNRVLLLIVLMGLCAPVFAHKGVVSGNVRLDRGGELAGTTVTAVADPFWGWETAERLAAAEKKNGKYPEATASGSATTDEAGNFAIEIEFTFTDDAEPPQRQIHRNGERVMVGYCAVLLTVKRAGYQTQQHRSSVNIDGNDYIMSTNLQQAVTLRGSLMQLSDRSAVANQALRLSLLAYNRGGELSENSVFEFSTDADGKFEFSDESLRAGQATLVPLGGSLAFASSSKAANVLYLNNGVLDLGALAVVPGGSCRFQVSDAVSGKPLEVTGTLNMRQGRARSVATAGGEAELLGLAVGDYDLVIRANAYWESTTSVKIEAGVETDFGEIKLQPHVSLEVIALSDGTGIEHYTVIATLIEGTAPYKTYDNRPVVLQGNLNFERNKMERMFSGKWRLSISAAGHASKEVEVTLPAAEPVTVKLEQGGSISATLKINDRDQRDFQMFAIAVDSPSYEKFKDFTVKDMDQFWRGERDPELRFPRESWGETRLIDALRPGTYLAFCYAGQWGLMKREVEVEKGKTTKVEFAPEPPVVVVSVTREGKPADGETFYICMGAEYGKFTMVEHVSGKDGKLEVSLERGATVYVLNRQEYEWIGEPVKDNWEWGSNLRALKGNGTQVRHGERVEIALELHEPGIVWLTLDIGMPAGATPNQPYLMPANDDGRSGRRQITGRLVGEKYRYARVPVGDYDVCMHVYDNARGTSNVMKQTITVDTPPEQEIKVDFEIRALNVRVNTAEGEPAANVDVSVTPVAGVGTPDSRHAARYTRTNAKGQAAFLFLADGSYFVSAMAFTGNRQLSAVASATVDASAEGELELTLSDNIGTLELDVQGNPALGADPNREGVFRVRLFNDMDEEVTPGVPSTAFGIVNYRVLVQGIPAGSYRVRISAYGLQAVEQLGVVIDKGGSTPLTVTPSAAGLLKVKFTGMTNQDVMAGSATATYYSADGNELEIEAPGKQIFSLNPEEYVKCEARLLNLTPAVKKVVIRIKGYEDIEIAVDVEPGKTLLHTATPKRKAD